MARSTSFQQTQSAVKPNTHLHCVICHQDFDPRYTSSTSCQVSHAWTSSTPAEDVNASTREKRKLVYWATCGCNAMHTSWEDLDDDGALLDVKFYPSANCYVGYHCSDPKAVRYNGTTMIPCQEADCARGRAARHLDIRRQAIESSSNGLPYEPVIEGKPYDIERVTSREEFFLRNDFLH